MQKTIKMTPRHSFFQIIVGIFFIMLASCQGNPIEKNQGVFSADKVSLKALIKAETDTSNALTSALLEKVIENAVIEFKINGDSISGLMFIAGQTTILNTKIQVQNDSMVIKTDKIDAYLIPNEKGLLFKNLNSKNSIQLLRSEQKDFSDKTKAAYISGLQNEKEREEFKQSLGKWKKGTVVDEFGDKTGAIFPYSVVLGSHETSAVVNSEVYVKTTIEAWGLHFQIFNNSMTLKESFPSKSFGIVKIKYPNGEVINERIYFSQSSIIEVPVNNKRLIYQHLMTDESELKILIDLSSASKYFSDKYQFTVRRNNLGEILSELKK